MPNSRVARTFVSVQGVNAEAVNADYSVLFQRHQLDRSWWQRLVFNIQRIECGSEISYGYNGADNSKENDEMSLLDVFSLYSTQ